MQGKKRKVYVLSTMTNKVIKVYDSMWAAVRGEEVEYRTIANQCYNGLCTGRNEYIKSRVYYRFDDVGINHKVLAVKDLYTGEYVGVFTHPMAVCKALPITYQTVLRTIKGITKPVKYGIEIVEVK